jgi:hypothetical protein
VESVRPFKSRQRSIDAYFLLDFEWYHIFSDRPESSATTAPRTVYIVTKNN